MHVTWKGSLTFGMVSLPIRLGVGARQERIELNMITMDGETPHAVGQQYYDKTTGEILKRDVTMRGYNVGGDAFVAFTNDELTALEPKSSKLIELQKFVPASDIDPMYFESSYYVEPEPAGKKAFALLVAAMKAGNRANGKNMMAVARWTHARREHTVAFRITEDGLMMHTLFYKDEIREAPSIEDVHISNGELNMASQLLKAMSGNFNPAEFQDTYRNNLQAQIDFRIANGDIKGVAPAAAANNTTIPAEAHDIMAALKASMAMMGKKVKKAGSGE